MPTQEQQPHASQPDTLQQAAATENEQRFRTVAVRVEEAVHAQLTFIADLAGTSLTEEVRRAIDSRVASAQDDPELVKRAQAAQDEIAREAAARSAAIAGFMGRAATGTTSGKTQARKRTTSH